MAFGDLAFARARPRRLIQAKPARRADASDLEVPHASVLDSLAVDCRFEPAVGGTSEALRVAVLPIREGKCLPGVLAPNGQ